MAAKDEIQQLTIKLRQYEFISTGLTGAVNQAGGGHNYLDAANQSTTSIINNVGDPDDQVDSHSQQTGLVNKSDESQTVLNKTSFS